MVLYSPHGRDQLTLLEQEFERRRPDIDVRWLDMGSQEVLDRLRFERVNPQADVWFGGPTTIFDRGVHDRCWRRTGRPGPSAVGPARRRSGRPLLPVVPHAGGDRLQQPGGVRARRRRGDWDDVLEPRWKDKVLIRDPMASGTMRAIWGLILAAQHLRETGDTGAGMAWLRRLDGQTKAYTLNPALLDDKLARQRGAGDALGPAGHPDQPGARACRSATSFPGAAPSVIDDAIGLVRGRAAPDGGAGVHRLRGQRRGPAARRARGVPAAGAHRPARRLGPGVGGARWSAR